MSKWKKFKREYFGTNILTNYEDGTINFDPESMKEVVNGKFKSYSEYLDVQANSIGKNRTYLELCYYDSFDDSFKGKVKRINFENNTVLFSRIMILGFYPDGNSFAGKEDHVWVTVEDTSAFKPEECIEFNAEVYRYMKHGQDGKIIDYSLQNLSNIKKISHYEVPSDEELIDQQIRQLAFETSRYYDHLDINTEDIINKDEFEHRVEVLKSLEPGKFTPVTVLLAYELEYRMLLQTGGIHLKESDKSSPMYETMLRFIEICKSEPMYYTGGIQEAYYRMLHPDKPRIYIGG